MGTLKRAWHFIESGVLEECVESRPRRFIAVFRTDGLYTKYQNINVIRYIIYLLVCHELTTQRYILILAKRWRNR